MTSTQINPMKQAKLLLCTDMDRTIIPNGLQPEHPDARRRFRLFCQQPNVTLIYVTGRHLSLVTKAIKNYFLPKPDFIITDVGTKIYQMQDDEWQSLQDWEQEIDKDWNGYTHSQIKQLLKNVKGINLQESSKQNTHKLSYYLPLYLNKNQVVAEVEGILAQRDIDASVVWSVDELKNIGLLDVLPRNATKLHAIEFLQQRLGYDLEDVMFAGDSGNDLPVLTSHIQSVLVKNASDDVKQAALALSRQNGVESALYIADSSDLNMNCNYSAGVLQGVWHYAPQFRDKL